MLFVYGTFRRVLTEKSYMPVASTRSCRSRPAASLIGTTAMIRSRGRSRLYMYRWNVASFDVSRRFPMAMARDRDGWSGAPMAVSPSWIAYSRRVSDAPGTPASGGVAALDSQHIRYPTPRSDLAAQAGRQGLAVAGVDRMPNRERADEHPLGTKADRCAMRRLLHSGRTCL